MSPTSDLSQLSILVIDDDEFMLDVVSMNLERLGITAVTACTEGHDALVRVDAGEQYDVAMVDLKMPVMDGIEVLRNLAVREFPGGILLFSGEDLRILKTAQSLASAHNLNVLGSLSKPVTADDLRERLTEFAPKLGRSPRAPIELVTPDELGTAIAERQIVPFFQPKVRVKDRSLASTEVLARWQHPQRGLVPPIAFISVAEENNLINDMTWLVLEQAFAQAGQWHEQGYDFSVGMNLSVDSLSEVDLPERIAALAEAHGLPCQSIELEITESRLMQKLTTALDVLTRLRLKGFGLSIDDFGTGYSSMSQLNNIPFTELKIDRAFVHGAAKDPAACAILESSAVLARKLGMTIVAEGVEDQSDWNQVEEIGCDLVQGYFIAKPMPAEEFDIWMREWETGNA